MLELNGRRLTVREGRWNQVTTDIEARAYASSTASLPLDAA